MELTTFAREKGEKSETGETKKKHGAWSIEKRWKGRVVLESSEAFQLREPGVSYYIDFDPKNDDIGAENEYFWNTYVNISI